MARLYAALEDTLMGAPTLVTRCLWNVKKMGLWLTVKPYTVNGTKLGV